MTTINKNLWFFLNLTKIESMISRHFDRSLWGLWYSDFMILYHLSLAPDNKLKRIDLADKVGLTASWVTRLLLPMEKIWLVNKEVNSKDARVSFVILAPGWKTKLEEALDRAELLIEEILPSIKDNKLEEFSKLLDIIWAMIR